MVHDMPIVALLPWTTVTNRLLFGHFEVIPRHEAVASDDLPEMYQGSVIDILESYGRVRPVDQKNIPLVRSIKHGLLEDLNEEDITAYFDFRFRLTFSALAAREFFSHRYCNSDSLRLVVQGFSTERGRSTLIITRRRDGNTRNIVAKDALRTRPPLHISWCELPRDLDTACLLALESATALQDSFAGRLMDAIQVFVGANSDSPDVSPRNEMVDSIGAFSRLFGAWREQDLVEAFMTALPPILDSDEASYGGRIDREPLKKMLSKGMTVRGAWLADAYRLRSQYAHGQVSEPPYRAAWNLGEHLLLSAYVFPLTVKARLAETGHYSWTAQDQWHTDAFDTLATLEQFSDLSSDEELEEDEEDNARLGSKGPTWRSTLSRFRLHSVIADLVRRFEAEPNPIAEHERLDEGEEENEQNVSS
jgi:hypothetical protein